MKQTSRPATQRKPSQWQDRLAAFTVIAGLGALIDLTVQGKIFQPLFDAVEKSEWSRVFPLPSTIWLFMGLSLLLFRTALLLRYRSTAPATPDDAPFLTAIIPAFNEGPMVEHTIDSIAGAHYRRDRLEILVVDDGSRDDTWRYITAAAERYPGMVTTFRFPENRGKRAALEAGFLHARGEMVVTIDSDSVIEPQTLLELVGPFRNPRIGAVGGKVVAFNRYRGIIPRMVHVRFILAFDMLRAVQSTYGTVYCCPGALSAYRRSIVLEVLPEWRHQRFLGATCTFGEDRALTNLILFKGYDTVYQSKAVVHTIVPETYGKLTKMYLRWDRSYIREEWRFLTRVLWKRPWRTRWISCIDVFFTNLRYPMMYTSLGMLVFLVHSSPYTLLRLLAAIGLISTLYMLYFLRSEKSLDFIYGIAYAYFSYFTLFWIFPYAILTLRAKSWLTR